MARIVIMGGGPAGYEAALVAAQHGSDVTVVERDGMGGACVLDDCVPSKTFISSAGIRVELHRAPELGLTADRQAVGVDLPDRERPGAQPGAGPVGRRPGPGRAGGHPGDPRHGRVRRGAGGRARRTSSRPPPRTAGPSSCRPTWC